MSEKPVKAAARELFEEVGLRVSSRKLRHIGSLALEVALSDGKLHKVYGLHYLAVVTPEEMDTARLKLQTEEVESAIIYNIDQMAADLQRDYALPESQRSFLPNPPKMWEMGLTAIRGVTATNS